jgi:hypothetical protein
MKKVIEELEAAIVDVQALFNGYNDHQLSYKIALDKWSKKEILGHLIDSAQNNIQRFVRGQHEHNSRIVYAQNEWVRIQQYQTYSSDDLVKLWVSLNKHICIILAGMSSDNYNNTVDTGKETVELHTLQFLAKDYVSHLLHHVKQIKG